MSNPSKPNLKNMMKFYGIKTGAKSKKPTQGAFGGKAKHNRNK